MKPKGFQNKGKEKIQIFSDMKGTEHFKLTIKEYLDNRASTDSLFAVSYTSIMPISDAVVKSIVKSNVSVFSLLNEKLN